MWLDPESERQAPEAVLEKLLGHLRAASPRASDLLPALQKALGGSHPATMRELETRIKAFDFEGAEDAVAELLALLQDPGRII